LVVVAVAALLAACGGSTAANTSTTSPAVTSAPATGSTTLTSASNATTSSTAPASIAKSGTPGSKASPIPLGTAAAVGDWKIKVTSANLKADAKLKSAPSYQAPDPGNQYVLLELDAAFSGLQPDSFSNGLGYQIIGSKGDTFDAVDLGLTKSIENTNAIVKGASVSGSLIFAVPSDQVLGATLWIAPSSAAQETGIYFALK
jgi:hypothetical protein